jgi:hypothetical protein
LRCFRFSLLARFWVFACISQGGNIIIMTFFIRCSALALVGSSTHTALSLCSSAEIGLPKIVRGFGNVKLLTTIPLLVALRKNDDFITIQRIGEYKSVSIRLKLWRMREVYFDCLEDMEEGTCLGPYSGMEAQRSKNNRITQGSV